MTDATRLYWQVWLAGAFAGLVGGFLLAAVLL